MRRKMSRALALMLATSMCLTTTNLTAFAQESNDVAVEQMVTVSGGDAGEVYESEEATEESEVESDETTEETTEESEAEVTEEATEEATEEVTEETTEESAEEVTEESTEEVAQDVIEDSVFYGENYVVTAHVIDSWENGYNASIKVENTGDTNVENWTMEFPYDVEITNIWNADITAYENGQYTVKNQGWNQDIVAGGSIEFGISVQEKFEAFPTEYTLIGSLNDVEESAYDIDYKLNSHWGQGFSAEISFKNNSEETIEDWILEFDYDNEITQLWNGVILSHEGNHYVIKNAGYNSNLTAGASLNIGFLGTGSAENVPTDYELFSYSEKFDILTISLEKLIASDTGFHFAEDFNGFTGQLKQAEKVTEFTLTVFDKNQEQIFATDITPAADWTCNDYALMYGQNTLVFEAKIDKKSDVKKLVVDSEGTVNFDKMVLDLDDADGDQLANYLERYFGTDPFAKDTDGDGLSDYEELYILGYNPLKVDTDDNSVLDGDEDADEDGLTNAEEVSLGSKMLDRDSDNDRLEDAEEIRFGTSPIMEDTDGDGLTDYEEYLFSQMNAVYDEATNQYTVEFSADKMIGDYDPAVVPTVKLTADKEGILTFAIERISGDFNLNPSMVGYIGAAYDFHTEGIMSRAELTFTYNENLVDAEMLASADFCPTIYYYDPETQMISEVEGQVWNGNQVTVTLPHFSTYMLINKADMERFWAETVEIEDTSVVVGNDVVFVIDKSGSMQSNDPNNIRASLINEFCSKISAYDKVALVGFENSATKYTEGLTGSKTELTEAIEKFKSVRDYGGTYMNKGVVVAATMLMEDNTPNVQKSIFCLTDGVTSDTLSTTYLQTLVDNNITLYTVGLGSVSASYLTRVATATGGKYFYARTSADLKEVFIDFQEEISSDSNDDGLDDELTKMICKGQITTFEGTTVFCSKANDDGWEEIYKKVLDSADYDEDGLKNGEEIEIYYVGQKPYIKFISSPEIEDTDCDGYTDYEEVKTYFTSPTCHTEMVNARDSIYIGSYMNYESGLAFDKYLDRSTGTIALEYILNVILLGGEASINKMAKVQLMDLMVQNAQANSNDLDFTASANYISAVVRGCVDLIPFAELGDMRMETTQKINELNKQIRMVRGTRNASSSRKIFKTKIENLEKDFGAAARKMYKEGSQSTASKYGTRIGIAVTIFACGVDLVEQYVEYQAGLKVAQQYDEWLTEMMFCGDDNIETAATTLRCEYEDKVFRNMTVAVDSVSTAFSYGTPAFESYLITAELGIPGLIIDLVWLAGGLLEGGALSNKIRNFVCVEIANSCSMALSDKLKYAKYIADANGNVNITSSLENVSMLYRFAIYSRIWTEAKYVSYLQKVRFGFDGDFFIDHSDDSEQKAQNNITNLKNMYANVR